MSDGEPSVFGVVQVGKGAFYVSASGDTIRLKDGGDGELGIAVGVKPKVAGFDLDLSIHPVHRVDTAPGYDANFVEYQTDIARSFGRFSTRLRFNYSPNADGPPRQAWWNEAQVGWRLDSADQLTAAVGRRTAKGGVDYTAWNMGVSHDLRPGLVADLRFYDTNSHELGSRFNERLVASLAQTF